MTYRPGSFERDLAPDEGVLHIIQTLEFGLRATDLVNQDASPFDEIMDQSGVRMIDGLEHEL